MDFERVLHLLEEEGSREEFLIRFKQAGENSQEFQSLRQIMISLGMHRTPRHVDQTTIIQHTFKFSEPFDCYTKFRLVCKAWKFAVETKPRSDHVDSKTCRAIREGQFTGRTYACVLPISYRKAIQSLKNIKMLSKDVLLSTLNYIAEYSCNLKSFYMQKPSHSRALTALSYPTSNYEVRIFQLLRNSNETISKVKLPVFVFPEAIQFPNLREMDLRFCTFDEILTIPEFEENFQNLLRLAPNIKVIKIDLDDVENEAEILEHLTENYAKHCVIYNDYTFDNEGMCYAYEHILNYLPVKIMSSLWEFHELASRRYADQIEYLRIMQNPSWNDHKSIFQSFPSLKGISIEPSMIQFGDCVMEKDFYENEDFMESVDEDYPGEDRLKSWREGLTYIQSIGIKILDFETFTSMEEKISQNIPWRFHFYCSET